jgi:hypothetical protein
MVRAVEVVDCLARQAIGAAAIEDVANVAEQDDGRIFILMLAGKDDGSLSRPRCPISAERIGNGNQGAAALEARIKSLAMSKSAVGKADRHR